MGKASPGSEGRLSGSSRSYIHDAIKAASHPVRRRILELLRQGPKSTIILETETGRSRYDIYHHLEVLRAAGLIKEELIGGKLKEFSLLEPKRPQAAVSLMNETLIREKRAAFDRLLDSLEEIEGREIPHRSRICKAQVILTYPWTSDE